MAINYGPGVSTYNDPTGRNFETVVVRENTPGFDFEVNQLQDLQSLARRSSLTNAAPSGFLTGDFNTPDVSDFIFGLTADTFNLQELTAHVNGWVFPVSNTANTGTDNIITLPAPSNVSGDVNADFVYLEVWRAVIEPDPSTTNKPSATSIYLNGNILSPPTVAVPDDLIDGTYGLPSALRIQIQYAIRATRLNSRFSRLGYDDVNVFAQGPNGAPTVYPFTPVSTDPGLWIAGTGTPGDTNTVDGYIYSIPIGIVFRRNSAAFDFLNNGNGGGLIVSGISGRPDGYYADQIVLNDILDLRRATAFHGVNLNQLHDLSLSLLLDNNLRQSVTDNAETAWEAAGYNVGNRYLKADDFIPSVPGTDLPSGNTIRSADGIATTFSDRPTLIAYTVEFPAPGGGWTTGDTITFDLNVISPLGVPLLNEMPAGTVISDFGSVNLNDFDGITNGYPAFPVDLAVGLNTSTVTLTLGASPVATSPESVYAVFYLDYPAGAGLTSHVTETMTDYFITVHAPSALNAAIGTVFTDDDAGRALVRNYIFGQFEAPHRELSLYYTTFAAVTASVYSSDTLTITLPEAIHNGVAGVVSVQDSLLNSYPVDSVDASARVITLQAGTPLPSNGELVTVTYFPLRPMPVVSTPFTIYYRTAAHGAVPFEYLPSSVDLRPVYLPPIAYAQTVSSGSPLTSYPYEAPGGQLPTHAQSPNYVDEASLLSPVAITVDDFDSETGLLQVPVFVPAAPSVTWTFDNPVNITVENEEFVDHYRTSPSLSYKPGIVAQGLSAYSRHRVFYPFLAQLLVDNDFGRAGEYVLAVLAKYYDFDRENVAAMSDIALDADGALAIYRIKGLWSSKI